MSVKLLVANFPHAVGEADLTRWLLEAEVPFTGLQIMRDRFTGESRGFGYLELENEEFAGRLIASRHGGTLAGRTIVLARARIPVR